MAGISCVPYSHRLICMCVCVCVCVCVRVCLTCIQATVLLGWIILTQHSDETFASLMDESELEEADRHFTTALASDPQDLEVRVFVGVWACVCLRGCVSVGVCAYVRVCVWGGHTCVCVWGPYMRVCGGEYVRVCVCVGGA